MTTSLTAFDFALLLIRVTLGVTMAAHGYNKFFGGGKIPGTARWFDSMGMRPGKVQAIMAASTEMGAGLLFAAGFLTPLAAAGIVALMVVAAYTVHFKNGFFIVKSGFEYNLMLGVVAVGITGIGPGEWSLDHAFGISDHSFMTGWAALAIAAGVGVASSVGLLAACYRPPAPTAD